MNTKDKPIEHSIETETGNIHVDKKEFDHIKDVYQSQCKLSDDECFEIRWYQDDYEYPNEILRTGHVRENKQLKARERILDIDTAFDVVAKLCASNANKFNEMSELISKYKGQTI